MRGLRRPAGAPSGAPAGAPAVLDARVLDGDHLLLAVRGREVPLVLRTSSGDLDVTTHAGADRAGRLTCATVPLTGHAGPDPHAEVRLEVLTRDARGRPAPVATSVGQADGARAGVGPGLDAPLDAAGTGRWEVQTHSGLVLVRRPAAPTVPVFALRGRGEDTEVVLAPGPDRRLAVRRDGRTLAAFPLDVVGDGTRLLRLGRLLGATTPDGGLDGGPGGGLDGVLHTDGHPLSRTRSHLARPQRATELPPLPSAAGAELRWTPAGHLALRPSGAR